MELADIIPKSFEKTVTVKDNPSEIYTKYFISNNTTNNTTHKTVRVQDNPSKICTKYFIFNKLNNTQYAKIKYILDSHGENELLEYTHSKLIQMFGCEQSQIYIKFK